MGPITYATTSDGSDGCVPATESNTALVKTCACIGMTSIAVCCSVLRSVTREIDAAPVVYVAASAPYLIQKCISLRFPSDFLAQCPSMSILRCVSVQKLSSSHDHLIMSTFSG